MRLLRFWLGRVLIHVGLRVMPPGRVRRELHGMLALWGARVRLEVEAGRRRA